MSTFATTLRPGYLVSVKTSVRGNVSYEKQDLDFLRIDAGTKTTWSTERIVLDEAEQVKAAETIGKARSLIKSVCSVTDFGYLCPTSLVEDLDRAVAEARALVKEFNANSKVTRVRLKFYKGYVADNDKDAIAAINEEVRDMLDDMREGLAELDVTKVREAASKATQLGQMLAPEAEMRIGLAVKAVREKATEIAKAVKAGSQASIAIDRATIQRIAEARTAFLDIEQEDREIVQPEAHARAIDLSPEGETGGNISAPSRELEVG